MMATHTDDWRDVASIDIDKENPSRLPDVRTTEASEEATKRVITAARSGDIPVFDTSGVGFDARGTALSALLFQAEVSYGQRVERDNGTDTITVVVYHGVEIDSEPTPIEIEVHAEADNYDVREVSVTAV